MSQTLRARSWVETANGHSEFPLQNLPLGIFSTGQMSKRPGVAIGDQVLDLAALADSGLLEGLALQAVRAVSGELNGLFALGREARIALRERLLTLLGSDCTQQAQVAQCLYDRDECTLHMPARVTDYTDFYVGIEHARNVGKLFRPDAPLLPNYKHVPIGYHGRASTLRTSGAPVWRPHGQTLPTGAQTPQFGPCQRLDFELELGIWIAQGNELGQPIPIADAGHHIAGLCLLNDWSARDIQAWEYQPLGPFMSKNFITSISPWVVTAEALEPFRRPQAPRAEADPPPLAYLWDDQDQARGALDIQLQVLILTPLMVEQGLAPHPLGRSNSSNMYWTMAQLVAHHSANGCQLQAGDLFGSGTLSGPSTAELGSLLEITEGGQMPVRLPSGESRCFLENGDEIIMRGHCHRPGFVSIGFGECRGTVTAALFG